MTTQTTEDSRKIAKLQADLAAVKSNPMLLKSEFDSSAELQAEFRNFEAFLSFRRNELAGRIKTLDSRKHGLTKVRQSDRSRI